MIKRKWILRGIAVASAALLVSIFLEPSSAIARACTSGQFRTWDYTNHTNAIGINGQLKTPSSSDVYGYGVNAPLAGDIGLLNYTSGEFVQYGWYLGSATGLPNATTPRVFFGESYSGGENLTAGPTLAWNTFYAFKIAKTTSGGYDMIFNGAHQLYNAFSHGTLPTPQITAETDVTCTRMYTLAVRNPSPPAHTLYYATGSPSSPTSNEFVDSYFTSNSSYISTSAGGQASFYGYGGG